MAPAMAGVPNAGATGARTRPDVDRMSGTGEGRTWESAGADSARKTDEDRWFH